MPVFFSTIMCLNQPLRLMWLRLWAPAAVEDDGRSCVVPSSARLDHEIAAQTMREGTARVGEAAVQNRQIVTQGHGIQNPQRSAGPVDAHGVEGLLGRRRIHGRR